MSRTKAPVIPTQSIERLFGECMKLYVASPKGKCEQFIRNSDPGDYDNKGNYVPRPLIEHLFAVASFLGDDAEDRFSDCIETTQTVTFRPESWVPDENAEESIPDTINKAAE
jgi:hypothetical protein